LENLKAVLQTSNGRHEFTLWVHINSEDNVKSEVFMTVKIQVEVFWVETAKFSETLVSLHNTTWHHNPEGYNLKINNFYNGPNDEGKSLNCLEVQAMRSIVFGLGLTNL
jgi:hypothetical protein